MSQALKEKNMHLSTFEKELLALVLAVKSWRPYPPRRAVQNEDRPAEFKVPPRVAGGHSNSTKVDFQATRL